MFTVTLPHFGSTKRKQEGEKNGGSASVPALLLPCGWRIQSLLAFPQDTKPTNTYFKVKEKKEEVWEGKERKTQEKNKKKRIIQTSQQVDRDSVRDKEKGRKKESWWYRQQNEQVMEAKWEWEQEKKKKKEGRPEKNQTWAQCNWGALANEHVMAARWDFPATSCCFPICSEERHSPTWGRVKASRWDCLRQMKQGVFDAISSGQKPDFLFCLWHKGCCVVCRTVQGFFFCCCFYCQSCK